MTDFSKNSLERCSDRLKKKLEPQQQSQSLVEQTHRLQVLFLLNQCVIDQSQHSSIIQTGVFQPFPSDQRFVRLILKKLSGSSYPRKWLSTVLISARNHWINIQRHNLLHAYSKKFGFAMSGKHFDSNPLLFMKYIHMYIVVEHPGNPIRMQWPFTWILTLWSSWTKILVSILYIYDITLSSFIGRFILLNYDNFHSTYIQLIKSMYFIFRLSGPEIKQSRNPCNRLIVKSHSQWKLVD